MAHMRNKLEDLKNNYITMREQSREMAKMTRHSEDVIKLNAGIITFDLVIEDLEKILSVSQHETSKVETNKQAKEVCIHEDTCQTYKHDPNYKCSECPFIEQTG